MPGHKAVFINEPKLSDFKQVLIKEGISAEFSAGVLVCNNTVAIRRVGISALFNYRSPFFPLDNMFRLMM